MMYFGAWRASEAQENILANTDSAIDNTTKSTALSYLEMRHIFVHRSGIADDIFVQNYGEHFGVTSGDKLPTEFATSRASMDATQVLCAAIDSELIRNNHVHSWESIAAYICNYELGNEG